jgi:uncharacterized membrane protein
MPISCSHCAAQMPENAAFCPGCGRPMLPAPGVQGRVGIFRENLAAALAYLTFIPAILFLILEPYKQNRFVRFHSVQCILLWVVGVLTAVAIKLLAMVLFLVPVIGPLLIVLISVLASLAVVVSWLVLVVKALQGETFKFPGLGGLAERYTDSL